MAGVTAVQACLALTWTCLNKDAWAVADVSSTWAPRNTTKETDVGPLFV